MFFVFPEGLIFWDGKAFFLQEIFFYWGDVFRSFLFVKSFYKLLNLDTAIPVIFYYLLILQLFTEQVLSTLILVSSSSSIWLLGMIRTDFPWSRVISSEFLKISLSLILLGKSASNGEEHKCFSELDNILFFAPFKDSTSLV